MNRVALPASQSFFARAIRWCVDFVQTRGRLEQFLRYTFVSGVCLGLDLAVFALLIWATVMATALAGAVSCMVGLVLHYFLSVSFVFDKAETNKSHRQLILQYVLTGVMGFSITASAILLTVDVAGLPAFVGKGFGVAANFICVYLVRAGYIFAPAKKNASSAVA